MSFAVSAVQHCIAILLGPSIAYLTDRVGGESVKSGCVVAGLVD